MRALITVLAYDIRDHQPILDSTGEPCESELETSTDIPADALGEVCASCMQKAWVTGIDGMNIKLVVITSPVE